MLRRCRKCRTVGDAEASPLCPGCDAPYGEGAPAQPPEPRAVDGQAARDRTWSNRVLVILGALAAAGIVAMLKARDESACLFALLSFFAVGAILWLFMARGIRKTSFGAVSRGVFYVLALFAAAAGSLILVFAACAAGGGVRVGG